MLAVVIITLGVGGTSNASSSIITLGEGAQAVLAVVIIITLGEGGTCSASSSNYNPG